jgi:hypothetical protein
MFRIGSTCLGESPRQFFEARASRAKLDGGRISAILFFPALSFLFRCDCALGVAFYEGNMGSQAWLLCTTGGVRVGEIGR